MNLCGPSYEYLLGAIHGDGNINFNITKKQGRVPSGLTVTVGRDDASYSEVIRNAMLDVFPEGNAYSKLEGSVYRVRIYNVTLAKHFFQWKHDGVWEVPDLKHPQHYLAGIWDTDGYIGGSRRTKIEVRIKKSGNLRHVARALSDLGFTRIVTKTRHYRNSLGCFESESICLSSKKDIVNFKELIPLRHPRKQNELANKTIDFEQIAGRRGHCEMLDEVRNILSGTTKTSSEIAASLGKIDPTHITKDLLKYSLAGFIRRRKVGRHYEYYL